MSSYSSYHNKYLYSHIEKGSLLDQCGIRDVLIKFKHNNKLCCLILSFAIVNICNKFFLKDNLFTYLNDFVEVFNNGKFNK